MLNIIPTSTIGKKILDLSTGLNFYGKKLREKKLEVCETVRSDLGLHYEPSLILEWLEEHKPAPTVKEKVARQNKPAANTMAGSTKSFRNDLKIIEGDRFIVTAAQNNTQVSPVFEQLKALADTLNARLIVLPLFYNKNAFSVAVESDKEYFVSEVQPYLIDSDCWLFGEEFARLTPTGAISPTAKLPVNSAMLINNGELATLVPSTKQQMRTLPRLLDQPIREAWATGCCTKYNYLRGRAGREAETDHIWGGVLIEIDEYDQMSFTNIKQGEDGSLMVLGRDGVIFNELGEIIDDRPAVKLGDLHCEMYDPDIWGKTLQLLSLCNPCFVAVDDILHFSTRSHHNIKDAGHLYATKNDRVVDDLEQVITQLNDLANITADDCVIYITESNHNSAIDTWLNSTSGSRIDFDPHNSKIYHLLKWLMCEAIDDGERTALALQIALQHSDLTKLPAISDKIVFGRMDEPMRVYGFDFSQHGHKGANGSRGSHAQFSKLQLKMVTGHTHSPELSRGGDMLTTGVTARLDQGYNRGGASSWQHSHGFVLPNSVGQIMCMNPQTVG